VRSCVRAVALFVSALIMRLLLSLFLVILTTASHAEEKLNQLFGCAVDVPSGTGWQTIEAQSTPEVTVLWAAQHPQRQASYGVSVLHNLPGKTLRDDANIAAIQNLLKGMGYQTIGHSVVMVAGRGWLQFPVRGNNAGQPVSGLIRYTLANDHVFGISMLVGGGKEASQDTEMQSSAATFRVIPIGAVAGTPPAPGEPSTTAPASGPPTAAETPAAEEESDNVGGIPKQYIKIGFISLIALVVILTLVKIIGGGGGEPPAQPPQRRL
jgi:hypothetical protein